MDIGTFAVEMLHITKSFGRTRANDDVTLRVRPGSIHALVGENGAGKSTLMRILYGMYIPDKGKIAVAGEEVHLSSPSGAIRLGIGMVHQHFMLIPEFTVTENVMLGKEPVAMLGRVDVHAARAHIDSLIGDFNFELDPELLVRDLPVGAQQQVEILKILFRDAEILILDEPTAVLTPQEIQRLFGTMRHMRSQGKTIILITHKLEEIMDISDEVTVLRDGKVVFQSETTKTNKNELTQQMIGRELRPERRRSPSLYGGEILRVENLCCKSTSHSRELKDISFSVESGEILGIAGVEGNGQTELIEVLTGKYPFNHGSISFEGETSHSRAFARSLAHIPEDRHRQGLVLDFSVEENSILGRQREELFNSRWSLDHGHISSFCSELVREFDVRVSSTKQFVRGLSGGNQQKIVVGRELMKETSFIVACHPARGLDIGATEFVHDALVAARNEGKAILLVSADLSELLELSDRIAVMYKGEIVAVKETEQWSEFELGAYMSGTRRKIT